MTAARRFRRAGARRRVMLAGPRRRPTPVPLGRRSEALGMWSFARINLRPGAAA